MSKEEKERIEEGKRREKCREWKRGWKEGYLEDKIRKTAWELGANKILREINDVPPSLV